MKQLLFEYDRRYQPPAAIADIEIAGESGDYEPVRVLVDTGSDGTLIPSDILRRVGARYFDAMNMRGVTGISRRVKLYVVDIRLGDMVMSIEVVSMPDGSEAILGRDVLNHLKMTLDGFSLYTTIETL